MQRAPKARQNRATWGEFTRRFREHHPFGINKLHSDGRRPLLTASGVQENGISRQTIMRPGCGSGGERARLSALVASKGAVGHFLPVTRYGR